MAPLQYIKDQVRLRPPHPYMHQPLKVELRLLQSSPEGALLRPLPLNKTFNECTLPHLPRLLTPRLAQLLRQHRAIQVKSLATEYNLGLLGDWEQLLHLVQSQEPPQDQYLQYPCRQRHPIMGIQHLQTNQDNKLRFHLKLA